MAASPGFSWDIPLPFGRTVGWVFQAGPDEPLKLWLRPGTTHAWSDARAAGKEPGQPVLFLQRGLGPPAWMGWGHILEPEERWKVYGVSTVCEESLDPPIPAVDLAIDVESLSASEDLWENRALGTAVGLLKYRDRTPYREVGARDLRLTNSDLQNLIRAQPHLRDLGRVPRPLPVSPIWDQEWSTPSASDPSRSARGPVDLQHAENLVMEDLKRIFGDDVQVSSLKTTPGRFRGRDYWVVEGSFWRNFAPRNFQYAITSDTGELAAKRIDR